MTLKEMDRSVLLIVPVIAGLIAFWFLVLAPKQDKVKALDTQVATLQGQVEEQRQAVLAGREARKRFPRDYHRLVVMGKAVPAEDETASLLVQINRIATGSGIVFDSISGGAIDSESAAAGGVVAPAPAIESAAATAPAGASVGSAAFTPLPYSLEFRGSFFEIADFLASLDRLVDPKGQRISADGQLVTVNDLTLAPDGESLKATLTVNAYRVAAGQGLTAGATTGGPEAAGATTSTTPTSSTTTSP